ncbi:UBN2_3 domain-containing protein [Cephalotus follicularis]|uniref:UBN2_3 domain-containing protein n=1 Tax=Cephalotus follicularis TaxID=3775 RepID=A0A1Q3CNK9_CEPFO|nr:UBN2_3 domain-containing protein [Cephalotus follicularis]
MPWARTVSIALGGRSKIRHIMGTVTPPAATNDKFESYRSSDNQVMTWIFNSMELEVYEILAYSKISKELWDSIKEHYGNQNNISRVFELQQEVCQNKQLPTQSFNEHLGLMKKRWDELKQYHPKAATVDEYVIHEEQDKLFMLLASVRPEYEDVKRQILMTTPLPSFATVCNIIQREETQRRVMNPVISSGGDKHENSAHHTAATNPSNIGFSSTGNLSGINPNFPTVPSPTSNFSRSSGRGKGKRRGSKYHCHRDGHTQDRCWIFHPHLKIQKDKPIGAVASASQSDESSEDFQSTLGKLAVQLQEYLSSNSSNKANNASHFVQSGKSYALSSQLSQSFIIDSGATYHMCYDPQCLSNISDATHIAPITIADGSQLPVKGLGQIEFFERPSKALFVPSLFVNLLSVAKTTNDLNCNVIFSPKKGGVSGHKHREEDW